MLTSNRAVVAITGAAGYLGGVLTSLLSQDERVEKIVGLDRRPPRRQPETLRFHRCSVTEPGLHGLFLQEGVTHVAHLAFHLAPNHYRRRTRQINVGGTENVLQACAAAGVQQVVLASSSVVFGAHQDNPPFIPEDWPFRPTPQVQYTLDKVEAEQIGARFRKEHSNISLTILRIVTIVGPDMNNFISRFLHKPVLVTPRGYDPPWQFVHQLDCARAFQTALFANCSGTYNLGADDPVRFSEILAAVGKPVLKVPRRMLKAATNVAWHLRLKPLTEIPGALIDYLCYPPVLCNDRIKQELGFDFQFTSREGIFSYLDQAFPGVRTSGGTPCRDRHGRREADRGGATIWKEGT